MAIIKTTRRGEAYYLVRWNYGGDKPYEQRGFKNESDAKRFARTVTAQTTTATERITVGQLCEAWMDQHVSELERRTVMDYRTQANARIKPGLGRKRAARLTPMDIHQWQLWMLSEGVSPAVANKSLRCLRAMLRWGRRMGLTETRAAEDTRSLPAPDPEPPRAYTRSEIERIVSGCKLLRDAVLIEVAAYSGLRASELFALRWADVDLTPGKERIHVRAAMDVGGRRKQPKTKRGKRTAGLLQPGADALRRWSEYGTTGLVFKNTIGGSLGTNWYHRELPAIRSDCGIHVTMQRLRDTYATLLVESGLPQATTMRWMGHESIATTLRYYADSFEDHDAAMLAAANASVSPVVSPAVSPASSESPVA